MVIKGKLSIESLFGKISSVSINANQSKNCNELRFNLSI